MTQERSIKVTVIVLTHNRLALLRDTVQTLRVQQFPADRLELIVVNDGSTDGTREWLDQQTATPSGPRLRAVHQPARGIPAARNAGIRAAAGEIIAIVADDYLLAPDYVHTFVEFFRERPNAQVVRFGIVPADRSPGSLLSHFYYEVSFRKRLQIHERPPPSSKKEKLFDYFRKLPAPPEQITTEHRLEAAGAAAFRRAVFERVGFFDETLKRAEDTDLSARLRHMGIDIYYYPFHKIRHRYGRWGGDTFKKSLESGYYAARLNAKQAQCPAANKRPSLSTGFTQRLLLLVWRVRQAANPVAALLLFPGILVFECAWLAGYRRGSRINKPPH